MKMIAFVFLSGALFAQEIPPPSPRPAEKGAHTAPAAVSVEAEKSLLFIETKNRAHDYVQAFDLLRKEKPSVKVMLRLLNSPSLIVSELIASTNGTLLFAKVASNSGSRYQILPIEQILEITYSPN